MKRNPCYKKCLKTLEEINRKFPGYNMGKHLVTALDGYDMWSISDKEMLFALDKYSAELEFDIPHTMGNSEIDRIVQEGMHLHSIFDEDDIDECDYI